MTLDEFKKQYKTLSLKDRTAEFNSLSKRERKMFIAVLDSKKREKFINDIRKQAVNDFWTHERSLIKDGKCTRDWTPEQIEEILNLKKNGSLKVNGGRAHEIDGESYYGHHMMNVENFDIYAGDWRNIQALNHDEHYHGAHGGNTKNKTEAYYAPESRVNIPIDAGQFSHSEEVIGGKGCVPTKQSIFASDKAIREKYPNVEKINDAEMLALKNIEYANSPKGTIADFNRAQEIIEKYKCKNFDEKFGINGKYYNEVPSQANSSLYMIDRNVGEAIKTDNGFISTSGYNNLNKIGAKKQYDKQEIKATSAVKPIRRGIKL